MSRWIGAHTTPIYGVASYWLGWLIGRYIR